MQQTDSTKRGGGGGLAVGQGEPNTETAKGTVGWVAHGLQPWNGSRAPPPPPRPRPLGGAICPRAILY